MTAERKTQILEESLSGAEVPFWAFLGGDDLQAACSGLGAAIHSKYGLAGARGAVLAALPYAELSDASPGWLSAWPGPRAMLARFARADWYGELVARLKDAAGRARALLAAAAELPGGRDSWRCLSNSGLPERELAMAAGLGERGRNGLVMLPGAGAACVLGVLLLPFSPVGAVKVADPGLLSPSCSSCRRCVEACPTGALEGGFQRSRCIQHWSTRPGELPPAIEAAWGDRLYGCDSCLEFCPRFRCDGGARTDRGVLGPYLPAAWLADTPEEGIREVLKGSALGLGWMRIETFRRNARLAQGRFDAEGRHA